MRAGLNAVVPELLLLMRSFDASRGQILKKIQVPTSLSYLFAGLRIAITFSMIGAVVAQFSSASEGLGYVIQYASTQLDTPLVFAGLVLISVLGVALYYSVSVVEWLIGRWLSLPHASAAEV